MKTEQLTLDFLKDNDASNNDSSDFTPLLSDDERPKKVQQITIPKGIKLKSNETWCPYCAKRVYFKKDKKLGLKRCTLCGISENDYYVKKANKR